MFGFASPTGSRLGSIAARAAQLQAQGQQQNAAASGATAQAPVAFTAPTQTPVIPPVDGQAQPAPQPQGPTPSVADAFHWIAQRFGGGDTTPATPAAAPYGDINMSAGSGGGGHAEMLAYLAKLFGG